jgi:hypothetical protein
VQGKERLQSGRECKLRRTEQLQGPGHFLPEGLIRFIL